MADSTQLLAIDRVLDFLCDIAKDVVQFPKDKEATAREFEMENKYEDKHCLYLVNRVSGWAMRDPIIREVLARRMCYAVDLLVRKLEDPTIEYKKPTLDQDGTEGTGLELRVFPGDGFMVGWDVYPMRSSPRGMCIIINNSDFGWLAPRRKGSEHDVCLMEVLFKAFLFNCVVHTDKKADEMVKLLSDVAESKEHERADCLVVILMSHGNEDTIYGVDCEKLSLHQDVYRRFNNENCPALTGKPKLFFIQASRGVSAGPSFYGLAEPPPERKVVPSGDYRKSWPSTDSRLSTTRPNNYGSGTGTIVYDAAASRPTAPEERQPTGRMTTWSDMYIVYASLHGFTSSPTRACGSWFSASLYKVFSEHAGTMHLEELMQLVHSEVLQRKKRDATTEIPTEKMLGWRKKLYFNPKMYVLDDNPHD
ncbi:hypothetical protein MTO96_012175 [Rhipicephalus appendiculatus]